MSNKTKFANLLIDHECMVHNPEIFVRSQGNVHQQFFYFCINGDIRKLMLMLIERDINASRLENNEQDIKY